MIEQSKVDGLLKELDRIVFAAVGSGAPPNWPREELCAAVQRWAQAQMRDALAQLEALTSAVERMRVPQTMADAALQITMTLGPAVRNAREFLNGAPPPEPKPGQECNHDLQSDEKTLRFRQDLGNMWECTVCEAQWGFPKQSEPLSPLQGYVCKCGQRLLYGNKHLNCPADSGAPAPAKPAYCSCNCLSDEYSDHAIDCPFYTAGKAARIASEPPAKPDEEPHPDRLEFYAVVTERRDHQPGPFDGPYLHGAHVSGASLLAIRERIKLLNVGGFEPLGWARVARVTVLEESK